jgi:preprotein translocase subunit SecF
VIHDFAFTLIVGIVIGTYSSISSPAPSCWPGRSPSGQEKGEK